MEWRWESFFSFLLLFYSVAERCCHVVLSGSALAVHQRLVTTHCFVTKQNITRREIFEKWWGEEIKLHTLPHLLWRGSFFDDISPKILRRGNQVGGAAHVGRAPPWEGLFSMLNEAFFFVSQKEWT